MKFHCSKTCNLPIFDSLLANQILGSLGITKQKTKKQKSHHQIDVTQRLRGIGCKGVHVHRDIPLIRDQGQRAIGGFLTTISDLIFTKKCPDVVTCQKKSSNFKVKYRILENPESGKIELAHTTSEAISITKCLKKQFPNHYFNHFSILRFPQIQNFIELTITTNFIT